MPIMEFVVLSKLLGKLSRWTFRRVWSKPVPIFEVGWGAFGCLASPPPAFRLLGLAQSRIPTGTGLNFWQGKLPQTFRNYFNHGD